MSDDVKKREEDKEVSLSPEIEKLLDEWTANPNSKVFAKLAEGYRKASLLDEAKQVCEKGLKANPSYLSGNMVLAKILFDKKEYDKSFEEVLKVTSAQSDNIMAQNLLLELYIKKGDKDNAIKICDIISFLDPKNEKIKNKKLELEEKGIIKEETETTPTKEESSEEMQIDSDDEDIGELTLEDIEEEEVDLEDPLPGDFATNTVAELYIKQGFHEKGLNIYKEMLVESPNDEKIIEKISEIKNMMEEKDSGAKSSAEGISSEEPEQETDISDTKEKEKQEQEQEQETKSVNAKEQIIRLSNFLDSIQRRGKR
jgi:tetratricopeptide (TPR) repeat protein